MFITNGKKRTRQFFKQNSGSRDIGEKGVKNVFSRDFLGNFSNNLVLQKKDIILSHVCLQNFKSRKILVLEIWGQKGSKMGYFRIFLKNNEQIWFDFRLKEDIIALHVCGNFQVQNNFGSRYMG